MHPIAIVVGPEADGLQRFAAEELRNYLRRLFDVPVEISEEKPKESAACIYLGLVSDPHIRQAGPRLPDLSDQGHLVRRL
ncbi:MAG: hypothetical protein GY953_06870, partial [bacterium]|nr:hypothetical protein [bacterium]